MSKSIINRLTYLDKKTIYLNKPNVILIEKDNKKNNWQIKEQYFNKNTASVDFKYYYYDDYNEYLDSANLPKDTPVIIFDL